MPALENILTHSEIRRLFRLAERIELNDADYMLEMMLAYTIAYGKKGRWYK